MHKQNYKNTDPVTSMFAGNDVETSGRASCQREAALKAVMLWPAKTTVELSKISGLDRYMLARRLPEISELKQGNDRKKRLCSVTGRMSVVWEINQ